VALPVQSVTAPRAKQPPRAIRSAVALIGFSAVIGQIVLMRELIVVFSGNEMSLGIMLATWLLWTAAGSYVSSRLRLGGNNARKAVAMLECLLGVSLLPTIWLLRASRNVFQSVPGELVGPGPMILTSLVCLSVFCALSGCLFVVATRMYAQACGVSGRVATSSAYLLEAAGSGAGGILASAVLLRFCGSYQIAAVVLLLNLCMAAILLLPRRRIRVISTALALAVLAGFLCVAVTPWLEESSQRRLWRGFHLLESRDSIYGKLAVTETGDIRSLYDNGLILASAPDESAAEEAVHYALLEHPAPRHVLLIGGGVNGSIAQALKHPTIERIDYVELDPALVSIARQFFPVQSASFSDPRVHAHYADGRHYLKTTGEKFDVIVVNVPDPQTAQLNRFYTREFFASARGHLAPGGVLALQLRSSEDYISPDLAAFLRCIQHTLRQVFPQIAVIPGETLHFFAAMQPGVLTENPQTLITRLQARHLATHYVREYFLPFRMMPDRMAQVHEQLQPLPETPVNRDFAPIAYYFSVELWSAQFHSAYTRWFRAAAQRSFGSVLTWSCTLLLLLAILLASRPVGEKRARASAAFCVAATGFTLMAQQIFLLLLFQSVYGYVYHQLAVLIAMFMAGIALGSWLAIRQIASGIDGGLMATAASIQFFLAASVPALMLLIALLAQTSGGSATLLTAQFVFPLLAALSGMLGGYQFPVATEIYLRDGSAQRGLGTLYALDLLGGCVGALLLSGYLIPVFGFWKTAWFSAAVNLAPAVLVAKLSRKPATAQP
jgi:spermidine synthase